MATLTLDSVLDQIDRARSVTSGLQDRWDQGEGHYRCDQSYAGDALVRNIRPYFVALSKPKIDQLIAAVMQAFTVSDTLVQATPIGDSDLDTDAIESFIQACFDHCDFIDKVLPLVLVGSATLEKGIVKVAGDVRRGFRIQPISLRDFVIAPNLSDPDKWRLIGNRVQTTMTEIERGIKEGVLRRTVVQPTTSDHDASGAPDDFVHGSESEHELDAPVEAWDVLIRGQDGQWHRYLASRGAETLLIVDDVQLEKPWFAIHAFGEEFTTFYSGNSLAYQVAGNQQRHNQLNHLLDITVAFLAMPQIFANIETTGLTHQTVHQIELGGVMPVVGNVRDSVQVLNIAGDLNGILAAIEQNKRDADAVLRISQIGVAQEMAGNKTASEVNTLRASQDRAERGYVAATARFIEDTARLLIDLAKNNPGWFGMALGDGLPKNFPACLDGEYALKATGRTPLASPDMYVQAVDSLVMLMQALGVPPDAKKMLALKAQGLGLAEGVTELVAPQVAEQWRAEEAGGPEGDDQAAMASILALGGMGGGAGAPSFGAGDPGVMPGEGAPY